MCFVKILFCWSHIFHQCYSPKYQVEGESKDCKTDSGTFVQSLRIDKCFLVLFISRPVFFIALHSLETLDWGNSPYLLKDGATGKEVERLISGFGHNMSKIGVEGHRHYKNVQGQ